MSDQQELERRLDGIERRLEALEWLATEDDLITAHLAVQFKRTQEAALGESDQ